jgi:hypothetical protein
MLVSIAVTVGSDPPSHGILDIGATTPIAFCRRLSDLHFFAHLDISYGAYIGLFRSFGC